eukprot:1599372-Pleurochrysis_carterae.AAC.1
MPRNILSTMPPEIRARIGGFVLEDEKSYGRYMSTSKDAQSVMDEYPTSLTPRGRALLISKRARKYYESHEREEPKAIIEFLYSMLGPTLMLREMGMQPDDLQLETMDEIRELVQYPTTASENYFTQLENLSRFGMLNPVPIWRKTYDYLTDEELLLRIKKNPHKGDRRHLITFDFLAHYGYMSLEE